MFYAIILSTYFYKDVYKSSSILICKNCENIIHQKNVDFNIIVLVVVSIYKEFLGKKSLIVCWNIKKYQE